ncbi:MAG: HAMP domain-containing sensor histidine kinase [Schleiferiaceae bacterium]|nr:HAMP domain-containing sensor histidine kinase [Schleiferiaceae bacterium]
MKQSQRRLRWLIALMTISLLGVSGIQAYWLRQAYLIKEKKLEQEISAALNKVTDRVEGMEALHFLRENLQVKPFFSQQLNLPGSSPSTPPPVDSMRRGGFKLTMRMGGDTVLVVGDNRPPGDTNGRPHTFRTRPDELLKRGLKLDHLLRKMAQHEIKRHRHLQAFITKEQLDSLIAFELQQRGITLPFEFGVLAGHEVKMASDNWQSRQDQYAAALFPNDFFSRQILYLDFPRKTNYLLGSLWWLLLLSLLFTTAVVFAFYRTVSFSIRQKRLSEIKTDFINNMTHEFKTPIATINLAIDALGSEKAIQDPQKIRHYSQMIKQENQRMNLQVETVLRMALMEKQELDLHRQETDVAQLIQECLRHIQLSLENRQGQLLRYFNAGPVKLKVDRNHLSNAIINLLDNALKYSPGQPRITVSTERTADHFLLHIRDEGLGMSRDELKHIFDRFYRVSRGNQHDIKGHGLGLSYAKGIAESHGGALTAESEKGKGSTFTLRLPL